MTDNYILCENAVISDLKNLGQYFPNDWQVSRDDTVLSRGAEYFAIIKPGTGGNQAIWSTVDLQVEWIMLINVYARWKGDIDTTLKRISECTEAIREMSIRDSFLDYIPGVMTSSVFDETNKTVCISDDRTAIIKKDEIHPRVLEK